MYDRARGDHRLTINERVNAVKCFYTAGGNVSTTQHEFSELMQQNSPISGQLNQLLRNLKLLSLLLLLPVLEDRYQFYQSSIVVEIEY